MAVTKFSLPEESEQYLAVRKNGRTPEEKWQPQQWKPEYEIIVMHQVNGKTNKEIAEITGYSIVQVSNILTSEHAKFVKQQVIERIRSNTMEENEIILNKATSRVKEFLHNDFQFEDKPIASVKVALSYIGMATKSEVLTPTVVNNTQNTQNVIIGDDAIRNLITGLNKANRAKEIHAGITGDTIN